MAKNLHLRLEKLERKAAAMNRLVTNPPPLLLVHYQDASEGMPVGVPVFAHEVDPLASLKRRLLATIARGRGTPPSS